MSFVNQIGKTNRLVFTKLKKKIENKKANEICVKEIGRPEILWVFLNLH